MSLGGGFMSLGGGFMSPGGEFMSPGPPYPSRMHPPNPSDAKRAAQDQRWSWGVGAANAEMYTGSPPVESSPPLIGLEGD
eukprot:7846335-Pyramimonas_sp.AAC.1